LRLIRTKKAGVISGEVQVEVEGIGNEVPQPQVYYSMPRIALPFLRRLRLRETVTKNLSLKYIIRCRGLRCLFWEGWGWGSRQQRTSASSILFGAAGCVAFSEKVEIEGIGNEEPQPQVYYSVPRVALPFWRRLRLRESIIKNLNLKYIIRCRRLHCLFGEDWDWGDWKRRTSASSILFGAGGCAAFSEKVEVEGFGNIEP